MLSDEERETVDRVRAQLTHGHSHDYGAPARMLAIIDRLTAAEPKCETCGSSVSSYRQGCPGCGAPQCCETCCRADTDAEPPAVVEQTAYCKECCGTGWLPTTLQFPAPAPRKCPNGCKPGQHYMLNRPAVAQGDYWSREQTEIREIEARDRAHTARGGIMGDVHYDRATLIRILKSRPAPALVDEEALAKWFRSKISPPFATPETLAQEGFLERFNARADKAAVADAKALIASGILRPMPTYAQVIDAIAQYTDHAQQTRAVLALIGGRG